VSRPRLLPHLTRFRRRAHDQVAGVLPLERSVRQRGHTAARCRTLRSRAVHRAYRRPVTDLPLAGVKLLWHLQVRHFFCRHAACLDGIGAILPFI
jgi:hypothetical protein